MYTFPQLLLRNFLLGLLFWLAMSAFAIFSLVGYLTEKNTAFRTSISNYAQVTSNDISAEDFSKSLQKQTSFQLLKIELLDGKAIVNQLEAPSMLAGLILAEPKRITLNKQKLLVTYVLSNEKETALLLKLLVVLAVFITLFLLFAATASNKRYKTIFNKFSQQIKNEIASIVDPKSLKDNQDEDILAIPELKKGLKEIHDLIESQRESSTILESEAYLDSLTKMSNRNRFIQYFENSITNDKKVQNGVLIITRCSELQTINQIHGYNEGDNYIKGVADIIKSTLASYASGECFRLNSSDFATVLPNSRIKEAEKYTKDLTGKFNDYQQAADIDSVAYSGLVYFDKDKPLGEILALADTGISVAQTQQINSWYSQKDSDLVNNNAASYGNQNWRQEIDSVLENQRVTLLVQQIKPNSRNTKMYGEVLARFLNSNDEMLPTASFIAMAEKLDKIVAVDRLIIETAIEEIKNKNIIDQSFGINISARTIHDEHFLIWLERRLLREPNVAPRLIFEITEYGLQQNIRTSKRFIDMIHRAGARITVERFGVGLTSFKFFRDLKPDFIKMDSTYTRDIDDDKNNQYFLRLMVDLAHRLSINVLAESVESQEEKHTLEKLFIDGCQGFYIGKPSTM